MINQKSDNKSNNPQTKTDKSDKEANPFNNLTPKLMKKQSSEFSGPVGSAEDEKEPVICELPVMKLFIFELKTTNNEKNKENDENQENNGQRKWVEKGKGNLKLCWIDKDKKTARIISRREHIHTLLLNASLKSVRIEKLAETKKHLRLYHTENNKVVTYLIQGKPESISNFFTEFEKTAKEIDPGYKTEADVALSVSESKTNEENKSEENQKT
eukprot:UN24242